MKRWRGLIAGMLTVSVAVNIFLLYTIFSLKNAQSDVPPDLSAKSTAAEIPSVQADKRNLASSSAMADAQRQTLTTRIKTLMAQSDFEQARVYLQNALKVHPYNLTLLFLEAELLMQTAPLSDVALHYYHMLDMPLSDNAHAQVSARLKKLVDDAINRLSQTQSWTALAVFTEPLFQYAPGNRQYTLALATAYAKQQKLGLMQATLADLPPDDPAHEKFASTYYREGVPDVEDRPRAATPFDASTPGLALVSRGSHFLAPVSINKITLSLLLDTGASQSALSSQTFKRIKGDIDYTFLGNFTISTASGISQAALIEVNGVSLSVFEINNVKMFVLPESANPKFDGLLGMNILGEFAFFIDQRMNTLYLQKDH